MVRGLSDSLIALNRSNSTSANDVVALALTPQPCTGPIRDRRPCQAGTTTTKHDLTCGFLEPMTGIEPAYSAWEADSRLELLSENAW